MPRCDGAGTWMKRDSDKMAELGVNIDHVATVRQARKTYEPDPVWAAALAELGGADCITLHLREDRRHIQERDVRVMRETVTVKLNLELACVDEVIRVATELRPDQATLVPERREEITTEGGLEVLSNRVPIADSIRRLQDAGMIVSLFLDPDPKQIEAAADLRADAVELHTGQYALSRGPERSRETDRLIAERRARPAPRNDTSRGSRIDLSQCSAGRGDPGDVRTEHRSQHYRPRVDGGDASRRSRNARPYSVRLVSRLWRCGRLPFRIRPTRSQPTPTPKLIPTHAAR